jgi:hypothetical protein
MNLKSLKGLHVGRLAPLGLAGALLLTSVVPAIAQSAESGSPSGLAGTWKVQVTVRDCASNVPLGAPFNSLVTFHRGGTVSESAGSLTFAPGQRTAGHGTWTHLGGQTYRQRMVSLILFDTAPNLPGTPSFNPALPVSPGFFAGWQTVTHTLELTDPDHATSAGTNEFFRLDGQSYRSGCSTAIAQWFE